MVPEGWKVKQLADICSKQISYGIVQTGEHQPNGIPCLRVVDLTKDEMHPEEMIRTSVEIHESYRKTILEKDEIVMALRGEVGLVRQIDTKLVGANITRGLARISAKPHIVAPEFLLWELRSPKFRADLMRRVGGSALQEISLSELRKVQTLIPPLPEQKKIAQILSTWDKAITTTEQLLANSQQQKKALMQQLLTGKKRLLDKSGVRFSGEWSSYLLEKLEELGWVMLGRGNVISKIDIENTPGDYPIYSSSVKNNGLMGKYGEHMFDEELITWSVDGGGNFFYRPKHKFSVTNVSGYMRINTEQLNYQFIAAQLEMHHSKLEFDYQSKAHPSVIRKIYTLAIPTLEEQQKIAAVLTTADQEIESLQQKVEALKQEKKALMQQLLTGKRRVLVS